MRGGKEVLRRTDLVDGILIEKFKLVGAKVRGA